MDSTEGQTSPKQRARDARQYGMHKYVQAHAHAQHRPEQDQKQEDHENRVIPDVLLVLPSSIELHVAMRSVREERDTRAGTAH